MLWIRVAYGDKLGAIWNEKVAGEVGTPIAETDNSNADQEALSKD